MQETQDTLGWSSRISLALAGALVLSATALCVQTGGSQPSQDQSQQPTQSQPAQDIPDAPSAVQPPPPPPAQQERPPAQLPSTQSPSGTTTPSQPAPDATSAGEEHPAPPPMPPVETVPPGSVPKQTSGGQQQLYRLVTNVNFVQVPVTVKDNDGRLVDGLLYKDFSVYENGKKQQMSFFTSDPFELSVAIVLDLGMPDVAVQKVNQTFPALVGAFSPYDEVAIYTYSSTVSQVSDYTGASQKLTAQLNQMKTERGHNNGPPVLSGPLAPNGPIINGIPAGSPTQPVYTPPKESHVLNDAILQAALDLSKRDRTRRKVIFVISDGRELGSKASYSDVLRVLLAQGIQVKAVAVEAAALPVYSKLERLHLPREGYGNILPKYASATGGGQVYSELSRNAIEDAYAQITSETRNQYTLGYTTRATASTTYHNIEVRVDRPGLKIYAKDGYYPAPSAPR
jgi:VWFA-related protein